MFIALVFLAHIYFDLIVSVTNVFVVYLSTINKHFFLLLTGVENSFILQSIQYRHHGIRHAPPAIGVKIVIMDLNQLQKHQFSFICAKPSFTCVLV